MFNEKILYGYVTNLPINKEKTICMSITKMSEILKIIHGTLSLSIIDIKFNTTKYYSKYSVTLNILRIWQAAIQPDLH